MASLESRAQQPRPQQASLDWQKYSTHNFTQPVAETDGAELPPRTAENKSPMYEIILRGGIRHTASPTYPSIYEGLGDGGGWKVKTTDQKGRTQSLVYSEYAVIAWQRIEESDQ